MYSGLYHFITNNETDFKIEKVEWIYEKNGGVYFRLYFVWHFLTGGCGTGSKNDAGTGKEQTFSHETREENEHQSKPDVLQPSAYGNVQGLNLEKEARFLL